MKGKKSVLVVLALLTVSLALVSVAVTSMSGGDGSGEMYGKNFGGSGQDYYQSVTAVPGGIVAVGYSGAFGDGDWTGVEGKGKIDAIIVKYDNNGNVIWKKNFGGSDDDYYYSVTAVPDGIVAVGISYQDSFGNGDWIGVAGKGYNDAIIVKYDNNGNVLWKKNIGGTNVDYYYSVAAVPDGVVAVGNSNSMGNGDWTDIKGKGGYDAIIVKYDNNGNVVWKKNFGGSGSDYYQSVTAVPDGIVVVGYSGAFGIGDWAGATGKGGWDAIIVKYDNNGNVVWKKNFGGSGYDYYYSVTAVPDGIVAAGYSNAFGDGDWIGFAGKGNNDATVVKYDNNGNVVWKKNFGGPDNDMYRSAAAVPDGIILAGHSGTLGDGDWTGVAGKGGADMILVKYDNNGNVVWKRNFGGSGNDACFSVTAVPDGVVAAGCSNAFDNGDWTGIVGKGNNDAIIVKYFVTAPAPVTNITGVPLTATAGIPLTLTGTVVPSEVAYKTITWSVKSAGTTGAIISGNVLSVAATGTVVVTAIVANGISPGVDFVKDFIIEAECASVLLEEIYKKSFGGSGQDEYLSVAATPDGIVAVGYSGAFGNGDWASIGGKGGTDAIIVKYDNNGNIVWKKSFGGSGQDHYRSVAVVSDGLIAVGYSSKFGNGDWAGVAGKDGTDAIIVKYDNNGNVVWKKNFGGSGQDYYNSVTAVPDGVVVVGYSTSFGNGDWAGVTGKGGYDAIIVKYDNNGNVVWKKNFGGSSGDYYQSVTTVSDGVVAAGYSEAFGNGDWASTVGKGSYDAIIVKYDNNGDVVWKKNFGTSGGDIYQSVTAVPDGIVVAGHSTSFSNGDWGGVAGKGGSDAIIVKYDNNGNVVWKKNFGGSGSDYYRSVTTVPDGVVAVGYSSLFGNGDWTGVMGKGDADAIIVKYDNNGDIVWKDNVGGSSGDCYYSVTAISGGIVAVGYSDVLDNGDWTGVAWKGNSDAIIVKYGVSVLVPVMDIIGVSSAATAGTPLTLTGTAVPSDAAYKTIIWSVKSAGTTGATISGNILLTTGAGKAVITATIANGIAPGIDFVKDFIIEAESAVAPWEEIYKKNFGGPVQDEYRSVAATPDGVVAVGYSNNVGDGDWAGVQGKGNYDAIIVKYDNNGNVVWKNNFGGSSTDYYYSVTAVFDGVIAVGYSYAGSFGNGDWAGVAGKGGADAIIVKYDNNGNVVWKKNFGGSGSEYYLSVITVSDGVVAAGYSDTFGNGDWAGVAGKGGADAIIVKYDNNGNVVWKKNFGGSGGDYYQSVTAVSDGFVAAGYSSAFGSGDWAGVGGKGGNDAIIVKYDNNGNVVWKKNFGGSAGDVYQSVTAVSDGIVAVGYSYLFGNGDWIGVGGKGGIDAIIVKYDNNGNVLLKKNFGGIGDDYYRSVTAVSDGIVIAGHSSSFGNGDWVGVTGKGGADAIIVKYDNNGNVVLKENFGGSGHDYYQSVTAVPGGIVAGGYSETFGNGDWAGTAGKGGSDAIIVKYGVTVLASVVDITGVSSIAAAGTPLTLTGMVVPSDAANQAIVWSVKNAGTTGATISGNVLSTTAAGTAVVTATIANGISPGVDFVKDFSISCSSDKYRVEASMTLGGTGVLWRTSTLVDQGTSFECEARSFEGYTFIGWYEGNTLLSASQLYSFTVSKDITIEGRLSATTQNVPVTDITGVPATAVAGTPLTLAGTASPNNATNKIITWSVKSAGTTGAAISGSTLSTTGTGTAVITATIANGTAPGVDFVKDFTISFSGYWVEIYITPGDAGTLNVYYNNENQENSGWVAAGTEIDCAVAPGNGWTFDGWYMGGTDFQWSVSTWHTFTVNGDIAIEGRLSALPTLIPVTDIIEVPSAAAAGIPLTLTGAAVPSNATHKDIVWTIKSAGTTGAAISGNILSATAGGTVTVTATIANGVAVGTPYTKDFTITVAAPVIPVMDIAGVPATAVAGIPLTLAGTVSPNNATNKTIMWSVKNAGTTGATISGSTLSTTGTGTAVITATVANGTAPGVDYVKDFTLTLGGYRVEIYVSPVNAGILSAVFSGANQVATTESAIVGWATAGTRIDFVVTPDEGWVFDGWYCEGANMFQGGWPVQNTGSIMVNGDITIEARLSVATANTVPVTDIAGVPTAAVAGTPLTLTGTVVPADATNKAISWSVKSPSSTTGASISVNVLSTTAAGTVVVTATIADGVAVGTPYTKDFTITVAAPVIPVMDITGVPTESVAGTPLTLTGTVAPSNATFQTISWSIKNYGTTGATINGNILSTTGSGTLTVTATIEKGNADGTSYVQDFIIESRDNLAPLDEIYRKNFGSSGNDIYQSVTAIHDGVIAVGYSATFNSGDWAGITTKGSQDAIIVKYDNDGNVVWKKNFGGNGIDAYNSVTAVPGGVIAVGYSATIGNGDWAGVTGKGNQDAIIVKYDNDGNVVWKKNFGGSGIDTYQSVTAVPDGVVAVGYSATFNSGDWAGITTKGSQDAIIVKYDNDGNVVWKKNFGGSGIDTYQSVTAVHDGVIAVGYSATFNSGDWAGITTKGSQDAIIVKYDNDGNVVWKKNFGGNGIDAYNSVTAVPGGVIAVGYSNAFGNGDWTGVTGKGNYDAIIVKYNNDGNAVWKKNFGGSGVDYYYSVMAIPGGVVAVGYSATFNSGDWAGITTKGNQDAIIVKYGVVVPVTSISEVPSAAVVRTPLTLTGTVDPSDATFQTISWSVRGLTGATISGNTLSTTTSGIAIVTATIAYGAGGGMPYAQEFTIRVEPVPVTNITGIPTTATAGTQLTLIGTVEPTNATNKTIAWEVKYPGTTGATITNTNRLNTTGVGTVTVTATITDGAAIGEPYTQDFDIVMTPVYVTGITGVPQVTVAGISLRLTGTVAPSNTTYKTINWYVKDKGTTGATIIGNTLWTSGSGKVIVTATIENGSATGDFTQDFTIQCYTIKVYTTPSEVGDAGGLRIIGGWVNDGNSGYYEFDCVVSNNTLNAGWVFEGWYRIDMGGEQWATTPWLPTFNVNRDMIIEGRFSHPAYFTVTTQNSTPTVITMTPTNSNDEISQRIWTISDTNGNILYNSTSDWGASYDYGSIGAFIIRHTITLINLNGYYELSYETYYWANPTFTWTYANSLLTPNREVEINNVRLLINNGTARMDVPQMSLRWYEEALNTEIKRSPHYDDLNTYIRSDDQIIRDIARAFNEITDGWRDVDRINFVLRFVQNIPYDNEEGDHITPDYWRLPAETLTENIGDCEDHVLLFVSLIGAMNYRYVIHWVEVLHNDGSVGIHLTAGVALNPNVAGRLPTNYDGTDYYYCEATWNRWELGEQPENSTIVRTWGNNGWHVVGYEGYWTHVPVVELNGKLYYAGLSGKPCEVVDVEGRQLVFVEFDDRTVWIRADYVISAVLNGTTYEGVVSGGTVYKVSAINVTRHASLTSDDGTRYVFELNSFLHAEYSMEVS
ncbi:MAG: hypothetical protein FWG96_06865 [Methanomassiliicoccaceae archaeon]|nr:hypothetical protein [Methanomassiliicoccaceae archaeon]